MKISSLMGYCHRPGLQWLAQIIIFLVYRLNGEKIFSVGYNPSIRLWEYQIGDSFFLTLYPSWFSSDAYYLHTFVKYSGHYYMPAKGDTIIDVGAGVGEEVLVMSRLVGIKGTVYAIEANPKTFNVLDFFCKKNKLSNARLFNLAIAKEAGHVFIEDDNVYGVQNSISNIYSDKRFRVESQSLDAFIEANHISDVDLLKVNIEGAEQFLIQGMKHSITKIRRVAISCHDFRWATGESEFFRTREVVIEFLKQHFNLTYQQSGDSVRDHYVYGTNKNLPTD